MNRYMQITLLLVISGIGLFGVLLNPALAQTAPLEISISARPSSPSPGESFTVQADHPTSDTKSSYFRWTINGQPHTELSGYGKNKVTLAAGEIGTATRISASITLPDGETKSGSLIVPVSDLSLIWSADTYVPKWYEGKALAAPKSIVRVAAIPEIFLDGQMVPTEKLVFSWLTNSVNVVSGPGEDVFEFETGELSDTTYPVEVRISDFRNRIFKYGLIRIAIRDPELVLYPFSPLGGIDPRSSVNSTLALERGIIDLELEPFFVLPKSKKGLTYAWTVGGFKVSGQPENPYILSIDASKYAASIVPIFVAVEQMQELYKYFSQNFLLNIR